MDFNLKVEKREIFRKKSANSSLRKSGFIPAVIYGEGKKGINIKLKNNEFVKAYNKSLGSVAFFSLEVGSKTYKTIIKEKQIHPSSRRVVHIDFLELTKGHTITMDIPIKLVGEPMGAKEGGIVEFLLHSVSITCLPSEILSVIEVNVSELNIGDGIKIGDIDFGSLTVNMDNAITVVHVVPPIKEEEVVPEESEESETVQEDETTQEDGSKDPQE